MLPPGAETEGELSMLEAALSVPAPPLIACAPESIDVAELPSFDCSRLVLASLLEGLLDVAELPSFDCLLSLLASLPEGLLDVAELPSFDCSRLVLASLLEGLFDVAEPLSFDCFPSPKSDMSKAGKIGLLPLVIASVWLAISALPVLGIFPRSELISFWALLEALSVVLPTFSRSTFDGWKSISAMVHLLSWGWSSQLRWFLATSDSM